MVCPLAEYAASTDPALRSHLERGPGIGKGGLYLAAVTDDTGVSQQAIDIGGPESGDHLGVETGEGSAETLTAAQDRRPRQPGLEALQGQTLEDAGLVAQDRKSVV